MKKLLMDLSKPLNLPITRAILKKHYRSSKPLSELNEVRRVLVLAPHMDDETIGLGGTIKKHAKAGAEVHCVFVTDGSGSVSALDQKALSEARKQEIDRVQEILGISHVYYLDLPDGSVRSDAASQMKLLDLLESVNPEMIYCPPFVDCHPDHTATTQLLSDALKQWQAGNSLIRLYEVNCPIPPGEINCVIDISNEFPDKKKAVNVFESQTIAFDGFLELNRIKTNLTNQHHINAAEVFVELPAKDFVEQFDRLAAKQYSYGTLFKQANRTVTLLWAVFQNYARKREIYKERHKEV
ncbi:MAG TPA: PIG-L family deacetylase [Bacillales bacterium]